MASAQSNFNFRLQFLIKILHNRKHLEKGEICHCCFEKSYLQPKDGDKCSNVSFPCLNAMAHKKATK